MLQHKKWETIVAYVKEIPIKKELVEQIEILLAVKKNVLLLMKKQDPNEIYDSSQIFHTPEEKFKALCELFPEQTKKGTLIISKVPDIQNIYEMNI